MTPSSQPPLSVAPRGQRPVLILSTFLLLGLAFFLATRRRSPVPATFPEVHRTNLQLRVDRWYSLAATTGFTGFLLDTYEDGSLKSRSAVSNGLLHGLSQGWYTNGQQQVEEHFLDGTSEGMRAKWHPNGQKRSEVMVRHGNLHGVFRSWHENGLPAEEVELTDGLPEGLSR